MKTIKVSDLQPGPQMNALVAEARRWQKANLDGVDFWIDPSAPSDHIDDDRPVVISSVLQYNPSGSGDFAIDLLDTHAIDLLSINGIKIAKIGSRWQCGKTSRIAICRAVIASRFGETVEVEE